MKKHIALCSSLLLGIALQAQNCKLTLKGSVNDKSLGKPLTHVSIFVQEISKITITDKDGHFELDNLCAGEYHLFVSHIGCAAEKIHMILNKDTCIHINLDHTPANLGTVVIEGKKDDHRAQAKVALSRQNIEDNGSKNLANMLENETGVNVIKNGSGIAKPVVHGMYGNRLTILNNGIIQSGQQWGNDHSPELDPYTADRITILKGASVIEYGGGNLGSVILIEPSAIEKEPHLHGQINYLFETNGLGHNLNTRLEQYTPLLAWRINGTIKKYGDRKTANYFLNNTGSELASFSAQLEKQWRNKLYMEFYGSTFNTRLGILRGSHIGNITDLEQALTADIPFFTEPNFSYKIDAPKQNVAHHMAKLKLKYLYKSNQTFEMVLAGQLNKRKEYDVRRSGRTDIPALSLSQYTQNIEFKYANDLGKHWLLTLGNQNIITDNTNSPETGILPLIPDYLLYKSGWYGTLAKKRAKAYYNLGLRYDYEYQSIKAISLLLPRKILNYNNQFNNIGALLAAKFDLSKTQYLSVNSGYAMRNPGVNELYSNGLHQGVSGIEEGMPDLDMEKSLKNTIEYAWLPSSNFSLNALAYHQHFNGFIFLNPQNQTRLTIRGAFPVFVYEQTNANIYGLDLSSQFTIANRFFGLIKYSYIKGSDVKFNRPLVFIPSNSGYASLIYRAQKTIKLFKKGLLQDSELEINSRLVLEQKNILPSQDFVPPPPAYNLLGIKLSSNLIFANHKMRGFIKVDNMLNVQYRDYLNRLRYFADDQGISVTMGVNFKF
jgi:iron complex outermembrane receptor protein